jgi:hypothetical protein
MSMSRLAPPAGHEPYTNDGLPSPVGYSVGVDLGQSRDFTAVVVNEIHHFHRITRQTDKLTGLPRTLREQLLVLHNIRHIERFPLGTPYPDIVRRIVEIMSRLPPKQRKPVLVADSTGVGRPVLDSMREAGLRPIGVTISGGVSEVEANWDDWRVPKKVLASLLHVLLDGRRLKFAAGMPELDTLTRELASFRVKVTASRNESFEAWREREHDDLVLACALAVWGAEKKMPEPARWIRFDFMSR